MTYTRKHIIIGAAVVGIVVVVALALGAWFTRPERTVRAFLEAAKSQNEEKAMSYVSQDISETRKEDIEFFLEDWAFDDSMVYVVGKEHAAWRTRDKGTTDAKGDVVKEFQPISQHVAHFYEQYATVAFDDWEDAVIIRLRRATDDTWSILGQLFRKWEIVDIRYQPSADDNFGEIDLDDLEEFED